MGGATASTHRVRAYRTWICRLGALVALTQAVAAQPAQGDRKGGPTPSAPGAAVYFIDIKDGSILPRKPMIRFGLRNMGVAPAGSERMNAGHHHILVDVPTPPLDRPIPNDFNHLHFGAGQTEAEIELTPGDHTLQLLLADKDHIPHNPPVLSEVVKVRVVEAPAAGTQAAAPAARHASPPGARVYFVQPRNGAVVPRKVTVRFGLVGMGVAPAGFDKANTGHHHLLIDAPLRSPDERIPNDFNHLHFGLGQTEAQVTLPLGTHTLQLVLADADHVPHVPPVMSETIKVLVTRNGRRPRVARHRDR
ncbi:DUF4399 domain-containing protein [Methylobacterium segetis]|uniref:DUF4399 domain-containing protein n=1 Tax=Methylobacterium segetis TaxID=2488750 RepID=UPI00104D3963|nr:DUF4399 domain-containing protein [Methylobacterium segetis]